MTKKYTLRHRVLSVILVLGLSTLVSILVCAKLYQELVYNVERTAIQQLVELKFIELHKSLQHLMTELGLTLQKEKKLRKAIRENDEPTIIHFLNDHFFQYYVTAEVISLQKIYLLDRNYNLVAQSTEGYKNTSLNDPLCPRLKEQGKQRQGVEHLKSISLMCKKDNRPFMAVLVPIGTISPMGYLQVVVDPTFDLKQIASALAIKMKVKYPDESIRFQSLDWPDDSTLMDYLFTELPIKNQYGEKIFELDIAQKIAEFRDAFIKTTQYVLATAAVLTFVAMILSVVILNRGFRQLTRISHAAKSVSEGKFESIPDTDIIEINSLVKSFNKMIAWVSDSQRHLQHLVDDATSNLQNAHNDLAKRNEELEAAIKMVEQANYTKSRFLANMSHELRTPLNAVIGYSEMIIEEINHEKNRQMLEDLTKIHQAGVHLLQLVDEILDISKIEAGKLELEIRQFNLTALLEEVIHTADPMAKQKNNTFCYDFTNHHVPIESDQVRLKQILFNLVSNACKFTENGHITITLEQRNANGVRHYILRISDTGIGIDKDQMGKLFQPFTQADISTTRKYGGTGLGLALSKQLCEALGGKIEVESATGHGSKFTVILPKVFELQKKRA